MMIKTVETHSQLVTEILLVLKGQSWMLSLQCHTVTVPAKPETNDGSNDDDVVDVSTNSSFERTTCLLMLHPGCCQPARTAKPAEPASTTQRSVKI